MTAEEEAEERRHIRSLGSRGPRYGLAEHQLLRMWTEQGARCAICGRAGAKGMNVDHDHKWGHVRGILCTACNSGLGLLRLEGPDALVKLDAMRQYFLRANAHPRRRGVRTWKAPA